MLGLTLTGLVSICSQPCNCVMCYSATHINVSMLSLQLDYDVISSKLVIDLVKLRDNSGSIPHALLEHLMTMHP